MTAIIKGQNFGDLYRTVHEDTMIDMLMLEGHANSSDTQAARLDSQAALNLACEAGLSTRLDDQGRRLFDPVEVMCRLKSAEAIAGSDFWARRMVPTLQQFVADLDAAGDAQVSVSYRRTFDTSRVPPETALRLRMPLPLQGRYEKLDIDLDLPPEVISHRLSDGRLEVRAGSSESKEISVGVKLDFRLTQNGDLAPPPADDIYLRPKEGLIVRTDRVSALARRLAGTARPDEAVRAFWNYIIDELAFMPIHYDQVPLDAPLDWVLDTGNYDCQLASALFVALCRTQGIPGRMVGGNFLYRRSPTNHYWAEIWLENSGWTSFDFISWDLSKGGEDSLWRDRFYGRIDARLIMECLPQSFIGAIGLPIPPVWHILRTIEGNGARIRLVGVDNVTVYQDHIAVH